MQSYFLPILLGNALLQLSGAGTKLATILQQVQGLSQRDADAIREYIEELNRISSGLGDLKDRAGISSALNQPITVDDPVDDFDWPPGWAI